MLYTMIPTQIEITCFFPYVFIFDCSGVQQCYVGQDWDIIMTFNL